MTLLSLFGGMFDLIENILLICVVFFKEKVLVYLSRLLIFVTPSKFVALSISVVVLVIGIFVSFFQERRN